MLVSGLLLVKEKSFPISYCINTLYEHLGGEKSLAFPVFHNFTGCNTTSACILWTRQEVSMEGMELF